jgi:hypothetical protein
MRVRERSAGFGLGECGRSRKSAGLGLEDLVVVIQRQDLDVTPDGSFVAGDQLRAVVDLDVAGGEPDREPTSGVAGGDGIETLRTATRARLSTLASRWRAGSNASAGGGIRCGASTVNAASMVTGRPVITAGVGPGQVITRNHVGGRFYTPLVAVPRTSAGQSLLTCRSRGIQSTRWLT